MSNDREELEERIAAFIDGQLPPAEAARLEILLANSDHKLAERVISMLHDKYNVQNLPKPKAPDELTARIMESVERASLMHGVEHLAHPQQKWWQSRSAIAAGLILVLGGFTYFIAQSFYRPPNDWHKMVAVGPQASPRAAAPAHAVNDELAKTASFDDAAHADKAKAVEGQALASADRDHVGGISGLEAGGGGTGGAGLRGNGVMSKGVAAPEVAAASANEAAIEKQLVRDQETVNAPYEAALKNGYAGADSPEAALAAVKADTRQTTRSTPVLLTLVARDSADPQKLRTLIQRFMSQDATLSSQQVALVDRVTTMNSIIVNGSSLGVNGANGSNSTLNNASAMTVSGTLSGSGSIAANGPASINSANDALNNAKSGSYAPGSSAVAIQPATQPAQTAANDSAQSYDAKRSGGNTFSAPQEQQYNGAITNNGGGLQYNFYNPRNQSFDQYGNSSANVSGDATATVTGGTVANVTAQNITRAGKDNGENSGSQYLQQRGVNVTHGSLAYAGGQAPFRLMLRPAQLNQIAGQFQVHSITRGTNAYVINNERLAENSYSRPTQIASGSLKANYGKGARDNTQYTPSPVATPEPAATAAPAPGAIAKNEKPGKLSGEFGPRSEAGQSGGESAAVQLKEGTREALQPRAAEVSPAAPQRDQVAEERKKETVGQKTADTLQPVQGKKGQQTGANAEDQWIECIITMNPAPMNNASMQLDTNTQRNGK